MLLLTDGTVMCQELATANWWKLSPDSSGSYVNGSWSARTSGPNGPTYFASAVLRDGRVFIAGGEDNFGNNGVDIAEAEIYDPVADAWTNIPIPSNPSTWTEIGDAPCCLLPDGTVLLGSITDQRTAIYNPVGNGWSAGPDKHDASSEETWTLLPDDTVLVAECQSHPATEKYVAAAGTWVSAGSIPSGHDLVQSSIGSSDEIGPAILMTDGRVFAIGASGHTALYTMPPIANQQGSWAPGPDFPSDAAGNLWQAFDAPAVLLPNGRVLCVAGPVQADGWAGNPCHCLEFDGTSLAQVADPPNGAGVETWELRMLLLPTGEVLVSNRSSDLRVYQPGGSPDPSWAPQITSAPASVRPGDTYVLKGRQLTGLSEANSYGDDATMATNFPLVRIRHLGSGNVHYCRTHDHSTRAVATGNVVQSTKFDVPAGVELGASELCVVANGIASCTPVVVSHKRWKELKWELKEHKEFKENFKAEIDVAYKGVLADIPKLKDAEGDPWERYAGDPGWLAAMRAIAERADQLTEQVEELRSFIRPEERPDLGVDVLSARGPEGESEND
ncbi:MAG TPA: kelch repeat-containing protein [Gaiellaceae bacterium]|nr:kelch repeat-containing protein [Gaiellaceae bacterium]